MNMSVGELIHDRAKHGPRSVIGRLREYARVRHEMPVNAFGNSPFAKIAEMQENAGIRTIGIRYDMIATEEDPELTPCPPDGGLGDLAERCDEALTRQVRCQEVATAINQMPKQYRAAIYAVYHVEQREKARTFEDAAKKLSIPKTTFQLLMGSAYGWLEGRLDLPVDRYTLGVPTEGSTTACVVRTKLA